LSRYYRQKYSKRIAAKQARKAMLDAGYDPTHLNAFIREDELRLYPSDGSESDTDDEEELSARLEAIATLTAHGPFPRVPAPALGNMPSAYTAPSPQEQVSHGVFSEAIVSLFLGNALLQTLTIQMT
jgi:hypothetical protein